jgi:O-antigen/teichoic acid export membrane protein
MTAPARRPRLGQQVAQAMAWNTMLAPLKTVVELAANLIILNVLLLPQVGVLRLITSAAGILGVWVDLGIDRSLPRFIPELEQQRGRAAVGHFMAWIFALKVLLLLLFSAVFLAFAGWFVETLLIGGIADLSDRFDATTRRALEQEIAALAPWMIGAVLALVALGSFYDGLMAFLVSYFRQRAWNLITIAGDLIQPTLTATLVLAQWGIAGVLVAIVVTPVISVVLAGWQVLNGLRERQASVSEPTAPLIAEAPITETPAKPPPPGEPLWRRFALYTGVSNVLNLSDMFVSWTFAIFLLGNPALAALYSVGTAMVRQALALLYRPLVGIQVPLFARVRGGDGSLPEAYAAVGRILALIMLPGGVGLVLLAHELILVQYPQYAPAALVIYILTPCLFLEAFLSSAQIVLQVYERYRLLLLSRAPTLLALPLMVWAAPRYGLAGAALSVGLGRVLFGLTAALLAQRVLPLRYSWRFFGRVALAALAMAGVVLALRWGLGLGTIGSGLGERLLAAGALIAVIAAGALSFVLALRLLGGIEPADRRWIAESRLPLRRWIVRFL